MKHNLRDFFYYSKLRGIHLHNVFWGNLGPMKQWVSGHGTSQEISGLVVYFQALEGLIPRTSLGFLKNIKKYSQSQCAFNQKNVCSDLNSNIDGSSHIRTIGLFKVAQSEIFYFLCIIERKDTFKFGALQAFFSWDLAGPLMFFTNLGSKATWDWTTDNSILSTVLSGCSDPFSNNNVFKTLQKAQNKMAKNYF